MSRDVRYPHYLTLAEIPKLLIISTAGVQRPDSSLSPAHKEEPVLDAQSKPLETPLTRPTSFTRAGALLRTEVSAATEQARQGG